MRDNILHIFFCISRDYIQEEAICLKRSETKESGHSTLTGEEEDVGILVFGNFVRALTRLHSQEADDVTHRLCTWKQHISHITQSVS